MLQVWVIHHLQVIVEAARGLSQSLRERQPEVPCPQIVALRNILVHEYFGLNMHQVWTMVQKDLPELEKRFNTSAHRSRPIPRDRRLRVLSSWSSLRPLRSWRETLLPV
jgi:uncharacterized protein with HEPN domain